VSGRPEPDRLICPTGDHGDHGAVGPTSVAGGREPSRADGPTKSSGSTRAIASGISLTIGVAARETAMTPAGPAADRSALALDWRARVLDWRDVDDSLFKRSPNT
jgi:hypothetical protein